MNVTTENFTSDYFHGLFEARPSKTISMTLSMLLMLVGSILCYSVIWYEHYGVDAKRTILNQLQSLQCWAALQFMICVTFLEWFRYISGPMPKFPCWLHVIVKEAIVSKLLLLQTGLIISRYAFIFWLKNPAAFNDEFWCLFINRWVNLFSVLSQFVFIYWPGRQRIGYYFCIGKDPLKDNILPTKNNISHNIIVYASLITHILMSMRIFWYKNKIKNSVTDSVCVQRNIFIKSLEKQSISDFVTLTCGLMCSIAFGFFILKYSKIEPCNYNYYPDYLAVYWIQLLNTPLIFNLVIILCYIKNQTMRTIMIRETIEYLKYLFRI